VLIMTHPGTLGAQLLSMIALLLCDAMHLWYSHGPVSVCLTSWSSTKTAKCRITQTKLHHSFLVPKISVKFDRGHPLRGRQMQVGWVIIGDF